MSERMRLAEDDTTGVVFLSPRSHSEAVSPGTPASSEPNPEPSAEPVRLVGTASRRILREERRERQRVAVICGLVVVACMAMTVFILGMARDRPARSTPAGASVVVAHPVLIVQSLSIPGASAPEGGHR